jgi:3-oxoacyl-(acyl-carrier-protein) synthase
MKLINFLRFVLAVGLLTTAVAYSHSGTGTFTVFSYGQSLSSAQLNENFAHIHDTFSGGITNVHISPSAAIAHSKLAQPNLLPKAVAMTTSACNGATSAICSISSLGNVTQIRGAGTAGRYSITLNYTPTSSTFPVVLTSNTSGNICSAITLSTTAPHVTIVCGNAAGGTAVDTAFTIVVYGS